VNTRLLIDSLDGAPIELGDEAVEVWACSRPSPAHPEHNEDAAGVWHTPNGGIVLAVADGMGGTPQGAECASIAIRQLDEHLRAPEPDADLRPLILDAFEQANRAIRERAPGSGTTLIVCELTEGVVRSYNAGDSGALLVGQRGRLKLETIAHSPVGYGVAAGLIDPDSALQHEDRHYVSNHLGSESMHIEMGSGRALATRDTLLLASDGLLDNLTPGDLIDTIRCGPLGRAAVELERRSREQMNDEDEGSHGKVDDLTFLLLRRRNQK